MKVVVGVLLLAAPLLCSAVSVSNVTDDPIHHSCLSNEECADRLNHIYPPYTFVCCTTVSCNDFYSKHYLVTSGCTPSSMCQFNITVSEDTLFAATMERLAWDKHENAMIGSCDLTRQVIGGLPPLPLQPKTATTLPAVQQSLRAPPAKPECSCGATEKCCVRVNCVDGTGSDAFYKVSTVCQRQCPAFFTSVYEEFNVFMGVEQWTRQNEYETSEQTPLVQSSCRETRFFLAWLQRNPQE